jgi:hypothetical protein
MADEAINQDPVSKTIFFGVERILCIKRSKAL